MYSLLPFVEKKGKKAYMYVFACIDKEHLWKNIQGTSATHHLCAGTCHWGTKMMDGLFTLGPFVPSDFKICNYITR